MFGGAFEPDAHGARLPALRALISLRGHWVNGTDSDVEDYTVFFYEFGFAFSLDVDECMREPALGEVEVLFDAVPFVRI